MQCKVCNISCNSILLPSVIFPWISSSLILENNCLTHQFLEYKRVIPRNMKYACQNPPCTRQSYSLLEVTIRKQWALAQNSWFIDPKLNRNCCNKWESHYSLTYTKWSIYDLFQSRCASVPHPYYNIQAEVPDAILHHSHPSWAKLSFKLSVPDFCKRS